ncbi:MAG TPA: protein kinase [Polyangiaceae bacterium]
MATPGETSRSETDWVPRVGDLVAGRYRVERVLGAGGMGAVVAARHTELDDVVAIKFLHPRLVADPSFSARFLREARVTARVKDDHVVRVFDVGTTESGLPFLAMELLEGEDLAAVCARGPMPLATAVDCFLQACVGLLHAHGVGVVHRDVKPSNLWLTRRADGAPLVKVLDFGISKLVEPAAGDKRLTETNSTFGSPTYMSPEQVRSARNVDARTDAWALGVVLFELLTAKLPFDAETTSGVLAAIMTDPPPALRSIAPDAPAEVEDVIARLLEKDVEKRATLVDSARRLRPFASPVGAACVDLIEARYAENAPAPATSSPAISARSGATVLGDTLPQLSVSTATTTRKSGGARVAIATAVLGAIATLAIAARLLTAHAAPSSRVSAPAPTLASHPSASIVATTSAAAPPVAITSEPTSAPLRPRTVARGGARPPVATAAPSASASTAPAVSASPPPTATPATTPRAATTEM